MRMRRQPTKTITEQIRQAIKDCDVTRYKIAQETGIDESTLAKFYHGERGLSMDSLNRLGEYLQLRIVMDRKPKPKDK